MIEILQQYWQSLLWSDGYRFTGVAVTLWLLIASVVMGGLLAIPMAVARVSSIRWVRFPVWLYTYVFRGTPLYVQLLVFYSGMYSLEIVRGSEFQRVFPQRAQLHHPGADAQHLRLYHRDLRRGHPLGAAR